MLHNKKIILAAIGILLLVATTLSVYFIQKSKPENVIESKLDLNLPSSSKIINYEYHEEGKYFYAKISIEEKNVSLIKKQLDDFFGGVTSKDFIENLPYFKNSCPWWDMDENNIKYGYMNFIDVKEWKKIMPHKVWAFISKDKEGRYYLYISY